MSSEQSQINRLPVRDAVAIRVACWWAASENVVDQIYDIVNIDYPIVIGVTDKNIRHERREQDSDPIDSFISHLSEQHWEDTGG
jgi:hypothetical protein